MRREGSARLPLRRLTDQAGIDLRFNASTGRVGLRQRSYLILGMPLWTVLSGQEWIALLGHELAHQVNGDTTHGLWAAIDAELAAGYAGAARRLLRS